MSLADPPPPAPPQTQPHPQVPVQSVTDMLLPNRQHGQYPPVAQPVSIVHPPTKPFQEPCPQPSLEDLTAASGDVLLEPLRLELGPGRSDAPSPVPMYMLHTEKGLQYMLLFSPFNCFVNNPLAPPLPKRRWWVLVTVYPPDSMSLVSRPAGTAVGLATTQGFVCPRYQESNPRRVEGPEC